MKPISEIGRRGVESKPILRDIDALAPKQHNERPHRHRGILFGRRPKVNVRYPSLAVPRLVSRPDHPKADRPVRALKRTGGKRPQPVIRRDRRAIRSQTPVQIGIHAYAVTQRTDAEWKAILIAI